MDEQQQGEVQQLLGKHTDVQKEWVGMDNHSWVDIQLKDIVSGRWVQPSGRVTFILRYPEGTRKDFAFTIVHVESDNNPVGLIEDKDYVREKKALQLR